MEKTPFDLCLSIWSENAAATTGDEKSFDEAGRFFGRRDRFQRKSRPVLLYCEYTKSQLQHTAGNGDKKRAVQRFAHHTALHFVNFHPMGRAFRQDPEGRLVTVDELDPAVQDRVQRVLAQNSEICFTVASAAKKEPK